MKKGFTLIELSVVLIVISLVIGGVLVGQDLIKTAQLNSLIKDIQKFDAAVKSFQAQYNQLPGDMDTAYNYWGTDCADSSERCNGDGNTNIDPHEIAKGWKHLDLAKYINGGLDLIDADGGTMKCTIGSRVPKTQMDKVSAAFASDGGGTSNALTLSVQNPSNVLVLKKMTSASYEDENCGDDSLHGFATSEQLYQIDSKVDDGLAYSGKVLNSQDMEGCSTSADVGTDDANYDLANSGDNLCVLFWRLKVQ